MAAVPGKHADIPIHRSQHQYCPCETASPKESPAITREVSLMGEPIDARLWADWKFHQATGMVAVQLDTHDMVAAADRLITVAAERGEPTDDTVAAVLDGRLRLS
jgi:hypothetical protein